MNDHHLIETDRLESVDFRVGGAIVAPDNLLFRRDFVAMQHRGANNISVGEHPRVVNFAASGKRIRPYDASVIDEVENVVAFAVIKERMLCQSAAGQRFGRHRRIGTNARKWTNWHVGFGRTFGRSVFKSFKDGEHVSAVIASRLIRGVHGSAAGDADANDAGESGGDEKFARVHEQDFIGTRGGVKLAGRTFVGLFAVIGLKWEY